MIIEYYTDGAASPNPGRGGWGFAQYIDGQLITSGSGGEPHTTNNRMEYMAMIAAIEHYINSPYYNNTPAYFYTDSNLLYQTMTSWYKGWRSNGWTRGKKHEAIMNLDLVQKVVELYESCDNISINKVKGHSTNSKNNYVDALAVAARKE